MEAIYRSIPFPDELRPFVRRCLLGVIDEPGRFEFPAPPTGYPYFGWVVRGSACGRSSGKEMPVHSGHAHFSGQIYRCPATLVLEAPVTHFIAELAPTALFEIHARNASTFTNRVVAVDPASASGSLAPLIGLDSNSGEPNAAFLSCLLALHRNRKTLSSEVANAVQKIEETRGLVEIQSLVRGSSPSSLSRSFKKCVGIPPKFFSRVLQINSAIKTLSEQIGTDRIADIASDHGFADEAHLSRSVRSFYEDTPASLRAQINAIIAAFPVGSSADV